ncbi:MAG TPA: thiamine phosphate synthase [Vicinamibacterales bacterium]|nr:thiamine phosphate synthase [Vicinamibacterales bacterium]
MQFPVICLITGGEGGVPGLVREAASAGVDVVQIREPQLQGGALLSYARQAVGESGHTSCRVLINDRLDIAIAATAAGVHLRGDSFPAVRVRSLAPAGFVIGRSVHSAAEAAAVTKQGGCDYLIFGTVFRSRSKAAGHPVAGLAVLREVCRATALPVIAVGGISLGNVAEVVAAGAKGVAAISLFREGEPLSSTVSRLRQRFDT